MNTQAAFKTLAVVLAIGALTGFNEWRKVYGVPPEVRAQRDIAQCVKDRQAASFRDNPLKFGHHVTQENQQFEAECRAQQGDGLQLGKGAAPVGQAKASASAPVEVNGLHYSPSGQVQTQSREQCLAQLEEARKRSPHGLAPEWEQRQKARCADLYSEATSQ
jgi:hypothetical protein